MNKDSFSVCGAICLRPGRVPQAVPLSLWDVQLFLTPCRFLPSSSRHAVEVSCKSHVVLTTQDKMSSQKVSHVGRVSASVKRSDVGGAAV